MGCGGWSDWLAKSLVAVGSAVIADDSRISAVIQALMRSAVLTGGGVTVVRVIVVVWGSGIVVGVHVYLVSPNGIWIYSPA